MEKNIRVNQLREIKSPETLYTIGIKSVNGNWKNFKFPLTTLNSYNKSLQSLYDFPEFNELNTYKKDQCVVFRESIYKFKRDHSGEWLGADVIRISPFLSNSNSYKSSIILNTIDKEGIPVPNIPIIIKSKDETKYKSIETDENGQYIFNAINYIDYILEFPKKQGYLIPERLYNFIGYEKNGKNIYIKCAEDVDTHTLSITFTGATVDNKICWRFCDQDYTIEKSAVTNNRITFIVPDNKEVTIKYPTITGYTTPANTVITLTRDENLTINYV